MKEVKQDSEYELRFPNVENYTKEEMAYYNENWHEIGDVRQWEELGYDVRTYRTVRAKDLWDLINICESYSSEPGILFIYNEYYMTYENAYDLQDFTTYT